MALPKRHPGSRSSRSSAAITPRRHEEPPQPGPAPISPAVESAPDCIITIDHQGRILDFTPAAEETFRFRREDALGRELAELIARLVPPTLAGRLRRRLAEVLTTGKGSIQRNPIALVARRQDGTEFPVEITVVRLPTTVPPMFAAFVRDVSGRRRADAPPARDERRLRALIEHSSEGIVLMDTSGVLRFVSTSTSRLIGYAPQELAGRSMLDLIHPDDRDGTAAALATLAQRPKETVTTAFRAGHKDGSWRWIEATATNLLGDLAVQAIVGNFRDVTEHRLLQETRQREELMGRLVALSGDLTRSLTLEEVLPVIGRTVLNLGGADRALVWLRESGTITCAWRHGVSDEYVAQVAAHLQDLPGAAIIGGSPSDLVQLPGGFVLVGKKPFLLPDRRALAPDSLVHRLTEAEGIHALALWPLIYERSVIGSVSCYYDAPHDWTQPEQDVFQVFCVQAAAAIQNARMYDSQRQKTAELEELHQDLQRQVETLKALYGSAQKFAESLDLQQLADDAVRTCVETFGVQLAWLGRAAPDGAVRLLAHYPPEIEFPRQIVTRWDDSPEARETTGRALRSGASAIVHDLTAAPNPPPWNPAAQAAGFRSSGGFPLISRTRTFGALGLYSSQVGFFTPERVEFFQAYAHQLAAALENARLFADAGRRMEQLQAQRSIDMAISSNLDLQLTLNIFLEHAVAQLGVDATAVLSFDARSQTLNFAAGRGFRSAAFKHTHLRVGEGHAGRAVHDRCLVSVRNLGDPPDGFVRSPRLASEGFISYYAVPLIAKGQIKGVFEVFHRSLLTPDQEWLDYLEAIAGQAAIAIDNATLLDDLQRANIDLMLAYDLTIEGWSRALDLRDKETEGHTERVTELTLRLARVLGVPEADLVHLRRGALLHDIGKMGIPDGILLKPGPLTEEEWAIMRRHPVYAYELLSPVAYLRPALDIPYCHHEKWDGTGYPRGLKGEQIPLAARIFAVADVWDALCSDRPYRPAWTEEQAREYIEKEVGTHFDPKVAIAFLKMQFG